MQCWVCPRQNQLERFFGQGVAGPSFLEIPSLELDTRTASRTHSPLLPRSMLQMGASWLQRIWTMPGDCDLRGLFVDQLHVLANVLVQFVASSPTAGCDKLAHDDHSLLQFLD